MVFTRTVRGSDGTLVESRAGKAEERPLTRNQRERQLDAREQRLATEQKKIDRFKTNLTAATADPLTWVQLGGHSYDELSEQMLRGGGPDKAKLARLQQLRDSQIVADFQEESRKLVQSDPRRFELTNRAGLARLPAHVQERTFAATGKLASHEQAAAVTEQALRGFYDRMRDSEYAEARERAERCSVRIVLDGSGKPKEESLVHSEKTDATSRMRKAKLAMDRVYVDGVIKAVGE